MMRSTAVVATDHAARYMSQLVKHFAHKLPTQLDAETGRIEFSSGICELQAGAALTLACIAPAETMAQLQDVVARHLARFAFRENELAIDWGLSVAA